MGKMQSTIETILKANFQPTHLQVENESYKHSVPAGSETHFKVIIVSAKFEGLSRVQRQKNVNAVIDILFKEGLHAFSQKTLTPKEFAANGGSLQTPDCNHAKK